MKTELKKKIVANKTTFNGLHDFVVSGLTLFCCGNEKRISWDFYGFFKNTDRPPVSTRGISDKFIFNLDFLRFFLTNFIFGLLNFSQFAFQLF